MAKKKKGQTLKDKKTHKESKVFIIHSGDDKEYADEITKLLKALNLTENQIVCSSTPTHLVPNGQEAYQYIRKQFQEFDLYVIYLLSDHFYNSASCLNEMGAAWILGMDGCPFCLPGFSPDKMDGVLPSSEIAIILDEDERTINDRLNILKRNIAQKFSVVDETDTAWDNAKNAFMRRIRMKKRAPGIKLEGYDLREESVALLGYIATSPSKTFCVLKSNGKIQRIQSGSKWVASMSMDKENADTNKWEYALEELKSESLIKETGTETHLFRLTENGLRMIIKEKDSKG